MSKFVPTGFYALERAVLLLARQLNPVLWDPARMSAAELSIYESLGDAVHYQNLSKLLRPLKVNESEKDAAGLIDERLRGYEQAQRRLRAALHAGSARSFLQISETGRRIEQEAASWAQDNAITWFDDGRAFLTDGAEERTSFGPYVPGAPDDVNYIERPKRVWASILIDQTSFDTATIDPVVVAVEQKDKGGRPPEYDGDAVKQYMLAQVGRYGVPGKNNKRFPVKSDLVAAILEEWARKDIHLAEPTVRRYVNRWLREL
jgi:hypothetical protein